MRRHASDLSKLKQKQLVWPRGVGEQNQDCSCSSFLAVIPALPKSWGRSLRETSHDRRSGYYQTKAGITANRTQSFLFLRVVDWILLQPMLISDPGNFSQSAASRAGSQEAGFPGQSGGEAN
jgi:hypothetical protein